MRHSAVVFAYHNVGVRGLSALLANGVDVKLVVTHKDNPRETIWFESVAELAMLNDIEVVYPDDPNSPDVLAKIDACRADWMFSFYYRNLLGAALLEMPRCGAYNLHGSLLPHYRGRVPVNWAVIEGETQTGASLHRMVEKPDAGALVDQQAVAILPNDTAYQVFQKVTCAAETVLMRSLPDLLAGTAKEIPLDLSVGSYYGGRGPEDGRLDWRNSAWRVHNMIRALAWPYPNAFFDFAGHRVHIRGSYFRDEGATGEGPRLHWSQGRCLADCADGRRLHITGLDIDGQSADEALFVQCFGNELNLIKNLAA